VQAATMLILVLAAEYRRTPTFRGLRRSSLATAIFPRQFMNQGDRLAFSNGILGLSALAAVLLIAFRGDTMRSFRST
jgi:hypothetical protein